MSILWDEETGTYWHHITGAALSGPLVGETMPVFNVIHTSAGAALDAHPDIRVAMSDRPIRGERELKDVEGRMSSLSGRFIGTIAEEDDRLPTMDIGVGIWDDRTARYYSMKEIRAAGNLIIDELGGRTVAIYMDPSTYSPIAAYTTAGSAAWEDDRLLFDDGSSIENGVLRDADGGRQEMERPLQLFTRWYGFALTFPSTEIWQPVEER